MTKILVTVPSEMAAFINSTHEPLPSWTARLSSGSGEQAFVTSDPKGKRLGSGGGTVNLLHAAWSAEEQGRGRTHRQLLEWLKTSQKLVLHAGGESRRLPAYA